MKRKLKLIILAPLTFMFFTTWSQGEFGKGMMSCALSPDSLHSIFNQYDSVTESGKGKGRGPFLRWFDFISERSFSEPFDPSAISKAMTEYPHLFSQNLNGNWTYQPFTFENSQPDEGGGAGRINMVRCFSWNPTEWYACAPSGGLWKSADSGSTWMQMGTDFLPSIGVSDVAVHPSDPDIIYIATGDSESGVTYSTGVMKTTDGGATWNPTGLNNTIEEFIYTNRLAVTPNEPDWIFAATSQGLFRSIDAGASFEELLDGEFEEVHFDLENHNVMYALADTALFISEDGGDNWIHITSGLPASGEIVRMSLSQSPADPNYIYIIVCGNDYGLEGIYQSIDRGFTFVQRHGSTPNVLGAGSDGLSTGGQGWYDLAIACGKENPEHILTGGINIWSSMDGGETMELLSDWTGTPFHTYIHADIHSIQLIPSSTLFLVGHDGGVSVLNGEVATDVSSGLEIAQVRSLDYKKSDPDFYISGWQDNGVNIADNGILTHHLDLDGMTCRISSINSNLLFASTQGGTIYHSFNNGQNFSVIANSGQTGVNETGGFVTPFCIGPEYGQVFIGKSRVYKSLNNGASFTSSAAFGSGPIRELDVALTNSNYIYASKNQSLYRSTNGNNFTLLAGLPGQYISGVEISDTNPLHVWVCFSGYNSSYKVYKTTTSGNNWTNISAGLPNIPVNCIVHQRDIPNAIYVGTDAGVYYRDDTTNGWIPFNTNLPICPISELVISYESHEIMASTYGRGIWKSPLYSIPDLEASIQTVNSPIGATCTQIIVPEITIANYGSTNIDSLEIHVVYENNIILSETIYTDIAAQQTEVIILDTLDFSPPETFELTFILQSVNGITDAFQTNDTLTISAQLDNTGTIPIKLEYTTLCGADLIEISVVGSNGVVHYNESGFEDYTYIERYFCIEDGCAEVIIDGFGESTLCNALGGAILNAETNEIIIDIPADVSAYAGYEFCAGDIIYGCTHTAACNYNPSADWDDNSCVFGLTPYVLSIYTDFWGDETSWQLIDENGIIVQSEAPSTLLSLSEHEWLLYLDSGCYSLVVFDTFGDGITSPGYVYLYDPSGNVLIDNPSFGTSISFEICATFSNEQICDELFGCLDETACNFETSATYSDNSCTYPGCTDVGACNFNPEAGCDDASCTYPGCTNASACNYNASAACDDGSCDFNCFGTCPGDLDNSGSITTSDLLIFIGGFGCVGPCGVADITNNGQVGIEDLLILLSTFGSICP